MGRLITRMVCVLWMALAGSCTRPPLTDPTLALQPVAAPRLEDDLPIEPLLSALDRQIPFLEKTAAFPHFKFGERTFTKAEYVAGLKRFVAILRGTPDLSDAFRTVEREFQFYRMGGAPGFLGVQPINLTE